MDLDIVYEELVVTVVFVLYIVSVVVMARNTMVKVREVDRYVEVNTLGAVEKVISTAVVIRRLQVIRLVHTMLAPIILVLVLFTNIDVVVKAFNTAVLLGVCAMNFADALVALEYANKIEALMDVKKDVLQHLASKN